jgi:arabinose-5-phosphate isomerase
MDIIQFVKNELKLEAKAISEVAERIDENTEKAIELICCCTGKIIVTGMGKTGIIARKIAATLTSTGTTAIFLHAAEGIHGDLGTLGNNDVVIAISNSGNTQELVSIIPFIKFRKIPIIALTGNKQSQLATNSDVVIDCNVPKEYEPFGVVPTSSTTVALAVGDALSIALLKKKNFREEDFAEFHPGGTIGKRLLLKVKDLMHSDDKNPVVSCTDKMDTAILEMTSKGLGCTNVTDKTGKLAGIITDGDLRRELSRELKNNRNILQENAEIVMTKNPKTANPENLAVDALNLMEDNKITMLPVINEIGVPVGMLHLHDLINAGII